MTRQTLAALWPHMRALLILAHVVAIIALSLPGPRHVLNPRGWNSDNTKAEIARWADRLSWLGHDTTPQQLERDLRALAERYVRVRASFIRPFARYAEYTGTRQGWTMFATPQKHPAELHIDIERGGAWQPIYRPHSDTHDFMADTFRHNRVRKQLGRFARSFTRHEYDPLARYVAMRAARAYPDATRIRVRLYRYRTLRPAAVRAGKTPAGTYTDQRLFAAGDLR